MMATSASTVSGSSTTNQGQTATSTSTTSGSTTTNYAFDSQNRLTQVSQSSNGGVAAVVMKAGYRVDGLRAWKENSQGVRTYFLYDDDQLVGEFDQSGTMQVSQTWGAEGLSYRRTASGASGGNRFYSWDTRANIAATTDATGAVINTPASDGFSSSGGAEPCATFGGQVGGYRDAETGLVLFGQRYYDPALGSWLTRDPIAEQGGINLYSYTQGNPVNRLDPSGLMVPPPEPDFWDKTGLRKVWNNQYVQMGLFGLSMASVMVDGVPAEVGEPAPFRIRPSVESPALKGSFYDPNVIDGNIEDWRSARGVAGRTSQYGEICKDLDSSLDRKAGDQVANRLRKALQKGPVGPEGQTGIKTLNHPEGKYTHELKIRGAGRILGYERSDGTYFFDKFLPKGLH
jgi:RHS repeat-associated protein